MLTTTQLPTAPFSTRGIMWVLGLTNLKETFQPYATPQFSQEKQWNL